MLKKEQLFSLSGENTPYERLDEGLIIEGNLIANDDLYIDGNLSVNGTLEGPGQVHISGRAAIRRNRGSLYTKESIDNPDLACKNGLTTFYGDTTFENSTANVVSDSNYGIENAADFAIYCTVEVTSRYYAVYNYGSFTVNGVLIAAATTGSGRGVCNTTYGTFVVGSNGSVETTSSGYGVYNYIAGVVNINGTLTVTQNLGYGVYNYMPSNSSPGIFTLDGVCYITIENTSNAKYGTITGTGTLYVNGEETSF